MKRDLTERVESTLTHSGAIRVLASAVQELMSAIFLNSPVKPFKDSMNGTGLEHPLHPALTDMPVGA